MTMAAALSLALLSISVLIGFLAAAIVIGRSVRSAAARHRARITAPVRPTLMAMLAEDEPSAQQDLLGRLAGVDERTWNALEPTIAELLGKLRGGSHDALRSLVEHRGGVDRARARTRRVGAIGRARAAELLGGLENPAVTDDLVRLLDDRDPEVRQVAARALGRSGDARSATPLLRSLTRASVPPRVVSQALLRLGPSANEALVAAIDDPDEMVRAVAVEILGLSSAVMASRAVERCLREDESLEVRIRAARALGKVGMPSALGALVDATRPDHPAPLRVVSARALGDLGHPGAVPRLLELLHDPVHRVAANAARSLAALGPAGRAALEQAAVDAAGDEPSAQHANEALARLRLNRTARQPAVARGA